MAGGKSKKKKWSKERSATRSRTRSCLMKITHARLLAEVPKMKLITPSALVERLKINGPWRGRRSGELQEKA